MGKTFKRFLTIALAMALFITSAPIVSEAAVVNNVITGGSGVLEKTLTTGENAKVTVSDCRLTAQVNNTVLKFMPVKSTGEPSAIVSYATIADDDLLHILVHSGEYYVFDLRGGCFARYDAYRSTSTQKYCRANAADAYRVFGSVITTTVWFKEVFEGTDDRVTAKLVQRAEFEELTDHTPTTPQVTYYTVVFKDYDGRVISTQSIEKGKAATAPANPSREGYTFTGWSASYTNIQSNIDIYAQYTQNAPQTVYYTVNFKDYDGRLIKTENVEKGKAATAPANPTREGYTFTGWDKTFNNVQSNLDVFAQYTQNTAPQPQVTYYAVVFKDFDGRVISSQSVEKGKAATAPANPTRSGYTFTGWDKAYNNVQSDLVVTAQYKQNDSGNTGGNTGGNTDGNTGSKSGSSASASASASAKVTVTVKPNKAGWFVRTNLGGNGYAKSVTLHKQGQGKVCTVKWNSKTKVAKFDGITYKNIKDVTYTRDSRQIIMLTKKGEVWIIPRAKGTINKTYKKKVIKGKWKSISKDNQGFAIRIVKGSTNNPTVKGVVKAQPKQVKKSK